MQLCGVFARKLHPVHHAHRFILLLTRRVGRWWIRRYVRVRRRRVLRHPWTRTRSTPRRPSRRRHRIPRALNENSRSIDALNFVGLDWTPRHAESFVFTNTQSVPRRDVSRVLFRPSRPSSESSDYRAPRRFLRVRLDGFWIGWIPIRIRSRCTHPPTQPVESSRVESPTE